MQSKRSNKSTLRDGTTLSDVMMIAVKAYIALADNPSITPDDAICTALKSITLTATEKKIILPAIKNALVYTQTH